VRCTNELCLVVVWWVWSCVNELCLVVVYCTNEVCRVSGKMSCV